MSDPLILMFDHFKQTRTLPDEQKTLAFIHQVKTAVLHHAPNSETIKKSISLDIPEATAALLDSKKITEETRQQLATIGLQEWIKNPFILKNGPTLVSSLLTKGGDPYKQQAGFTEGSIVQKLGYMLGLQEKEQANLPGVGSKYTAGSLKQLQDVWKLMNKFATTPEAKDVMARADSIRHSITTMRQRPKLSSVVSGNSNNTTKMRRDPTP